MMPYIYLLWSRPRLEHFNEKTLFHIFTRGFGGEKKGKDCWVKVLSPGYVWLRLGGLTLALALSILIVTGRFLPSNQQFHY